MTVIDEVRAALAPDEPNYTAAARLGPEALPVLQELVHGDDAMLAAKAAYLAGLIPGENRSEVLAAAAGSSEPTVRVAAAAALGNLAAEQAGPIADTLLADADAGIRKQALRAAARFRTSAAMTERVRKVARADPEPALRQQAEEALNR